MSRRTCLRGTSIKCALALFGDGFKNALPAALSCEAQGFRIIRKLGTRASAAASLASTTIEAPLAENRYTRDEAGPTTVMPVCPKYLK
jgi:hypothetical protein